MLKYREQVSKEVLMQPVQDCLCRAVLFQGFVVTSILDAYNISLLTWPSKAPKMLIFRFVGIFENIILFMLI